MPTVIPTLSSSDTDTFISSPLAKGRRLLTNYLLSDRWQSHSYNSTIASAVDILLEYTDDMDAMVNAVKTNLEKLYLRHFEKVNLDVYAEEDTRTLHIGLTWFHDSVPYSYIMHGVEFDQILSRVTNEHNLGDPTNDSRYNANS